jgi:hypothetical protein
MIPNSEIVALLAKFPEEKAAPASPAVAWWQCPTWITNGITSPASQGHGVCAAGMTSTDGRTIFISLANPSNVLPLVIWESRNAAWILAGCGEQAY